MPYADKKKQTEYHKQHDYMNKYRFNSTLVKCLKCNQELVTQGTMQATRCDCGETTLTGGRYQTKTLQQMNKRRTQ